MLIFLGSFVMMQNNTNIIRKSQSRTAHKNKSAIATMNIVRFFFLVAFFPRANAAAINEQTIALEERCLVCGDGQIVTNPGAAFMFPGQVRWQWLTAYCYGAYYLATQLSSHWCLNSSTGNYCFMWYSAGCRSERSSASRAVSSFTKSYPWSMWL